MKMLNIVTSEVPPVTKLIYTLCNVKEICHFLIWFDLIPY